MVVAPKKTAPNTPENPDCAGLRDRKAAVQQSTDRRNGQINQLNSELLHNASLDAFEGVDGDGLNEILESTGVGVDILDTAGVPGIGGMGTGALDAGANIGSGASNIVDGNYGEGAIQVSTGVVNGTIALASVHNAYPSQFLPPGYSSRTLYTRVARTAGPAGLLSGIAANFTAWTNRYQQAQVRSSINQTMDTLNNINDAAHGTYQDVVQEMQEKGCK